MEIISHMDNLSNGFRYRRQYPPQKRRISRDAAGIYPEPMSMPDGTC